MTKKVWVVINQDRIDKDSKYKVDYLVDSVWTSKKAAIKYCNTKPYRYHITNLKGIKLNTPEQSLLTLAFKRLHNLIKKQIATQEQVLQYNLIKKDYITWNELQYFPNEISKYE